MRKALPPDVKREDALSCRCKGLILGEATPHLPCSTHPPGEPSMPARPLTIPLLGAGIAVVLLVCTLLACAPERPVTTSSPGSPARRDSPAQGTVLATRPLAIRGEVATLPTRSVAQGPNSAEPEMEITVRDDAGSTLQVTQVNSEGLRAGDRVVILRGERTRLSRSGG